MNRSLAALLALALMTACAAKPKALEPLKPAPISTVSVELPVPTCPAPAPAATKPKSSSSKNAADWKAYALKLEQLLGIDHDGDAP